MDELTKRISEHLGVSQEQARKAALIMTGYLQSKLPPAIFADVRTVLDVPDATDEEIRALGEYRFP